MSGILNRTSNSISIASFWENWLLDKYNVNPVYQRHSVWSDEKQSFLIDSILRNFPIPPIFLHQHIDMQSGKTIYDVIDGKQRLTAVSRFIKGEIPSSSESVIDDSSGSKIAGCFFEDLDRPDLQKYKHHFWRYELPIEYVDTEDKTLIDDIFDRLNRNGEPLRGQELRNARYHGSKLLSFVQDKAASEFWRTRLEYVDRSRMEDLEFVSELVLMILTHGPLSADQAVLDRLYNQYANGEVEWAEMDSDFEATTQYLQRLNLDYEGYKITGVSHLYGLWSLSWYFKQESSPSKIKGHLDEFYNKLRSRMWSDHFISMYRDSMSSRTKDRSQRLKRLRALAGFCELQLPQELAAEET